MFDGGFLGDMGRLFPPPPRCPSPPRCINGYRRLTAGGDPAMD